MSWFTHGGRVLAASLVLVCGLCAASQAQQAYNVKLYKQFTLSQLGASAGNDCWGYVSPSGREYGIVSLNNKVVFIDVTDPANSVKFAEIPHSSSTWGDVKVYKNVAYAVTETSGTGIQVIDLSDIDNHVVTLVRTLSGPGRNHNLSLDTASGYLYTCGSRDGTGTTVCFDLNQDPLNPVQVGSPSLTTTYQHDANTVTYTSGPYAGRQIMFGCGEGRGLEIWDVTNKSNVALIKRIAYPFVGYCHQCWLSGDRHYLYVDDELDEYYGYVSTTRTLVFDVSVLETADLVSTYTTGTTAIDHNLYWRNGFIFQSDYASGLRIFNANVDPLNPPQVGWYDTFPADDRTDFVGTWSNYSFFPSGTVIVSDINGGAFILDVSDATKTGIPTDNFQAVRGHVLSGGVPEVATVDGQYLTVQKGIIANATESPIQVQFVGTCPWSDVSRLQLNLCSKVNTAGLVQTVELYDWTSSAWVTVSSGAAPTSDTTVSLPATNPDRFVNQTTRQVKAQVSYKQSGPVTVSVFKADFDLLSWTVNP